MIDKLTRRWNLSKLLSVDAAVYNRRVEDIWKLHGKHRPCHFTTQVLTASTQPQTKFEGVGLTFISLGLEKLVTTLQLGEREGDGGEVNMNRLSS